MYGKFVPVHLVSTYGEVEVYRLSLLASSLDAMSDDFYALVAWPFGQVPQVCIV
jgi:hypothetical protein